MALVIDESRFVSGEVKIPVSSKTMTRSTMDVRLKCFIQMNGIDVALSDAMDYQPDVLSCHLHCK